jgi:ATP-binding cassette, subfamily B, bacterial PglK
MPAPERDLSLRRMLARLWSLLDRRRRRQFAWLQLVSVLMAFSTLAGIAAIVPFFSVLADPAAVSRGGALRWLHELGGFMRREDFLLFLAGGFICMVVLANAVNLLGAMALNRFALALGRDLHVALYDEYLHRDYPFHLRSGAATLANNVINETARVVAGIVQGGLGLFSNLLVCAFIIASIVVVNPLLALLAASLVAGSYLAIYLALRRPLARRGALEGEIWDARTRTLHESLGAIKDVLLRGVQAPFRDAFARHSDDIVRVSSSIWAMSQAPRYIIECVLVVGLVGAALWLGRGAGGAHWLGELSFLGFAAYRLLPAIQQAFAGLARIRAHRAAFARVAPDLERSLGAVRAPPSPQSQARWQDRPQVSVTLRDVSFRYDAAAPWAVRGICAEIRRGEVVGIAGANGAGKSTLADLLLGLLTPDSGRIEVDGMPLDADSIAAWRTTVAYVPQHIFLLDASLAANIAFGVPPAQMDLARVRAAARAANLDALVDRAPEGFDLRLGERGARLSGGERQRVGIARALYHRASLLVLDEASNALDSEAERDLGAMLAALRGQMTVIVIAHGAHALRACDTVIQLDGGAVLSISSYQQWAQRGLPSRRAAAP